MSRATIGADAAMDRCRSRRIEGGQRADQPVAFFEDIMDLMARLAVRLGRWETAESCIALRIARGV
jgi:hypothetical protein